MQLLSIKKTALSALGTGIALWVGLVFIASISKMLLVMAVAVWSVYVWMTTKHRFSRIASLFVLAGAGLWIVFSKTFFWLIIITMFAVVTHLWQTKYTSQKKL